MGLAAPCVAFSSPTSGSAPLPLNESAHAGGSNDARSTAQGCSHKALPRKICA